jgi:hypothetical protein
MSRFSAERQMSLFNSSAGDVETGATEALPLQSEPVGSGERTLHPAWAALHVTVGTLLVAAAVLKAYQAGTSLPGIPLRLRLLDLALIEFEFVVGGMLLLNVWRVGAWALTVAAFTIFAGVSVKRAMAGASSCGCFGPARVDPKLMAGVDMLVVLLLMLSGPRPASRRPRGAFVRAGGAVLLALMVLAAGAVAFAAVPKRGLVAENGAFDFGIVNPAQANRAEHTFTVRNTSQRPIRITGSRSSCRCTVAEMATTPIAPGEATKVHVRADWSKVVGSASAQVTLETDNRWTPEVPLVINGQVAEGSASGPR